MYVYILIHVYVYTYICIYIYMMIYIPQDVLPMTGDAWASISEEAKDFISNCLTVDVLRRATLAKCVSVLQCGRVGCSVVHVVAVRCCSLFGLCIASTVDMLWRATFKKVRLCIIAVCFWKIERLVWISWLLQCLAVDVLWRATFANVCCCVLLCVAMCYCVLQFVVEVPRRRQAMAGHVCKSSSVCCSLLQRVAACCSFLMQCFTVDVLRRATLSKCVAVWCSVFFQLDAYIYICTNWRKHECFSDLCCAKYTYICMYIYMHIYIHMYMNT